MLPRLNVSPPPWKSTPAEVAIDAFHHAVYVIVTGLAYAALDRWRGVDQRSLVAYRYAFWAAGRTPAAAPGRLTLAPAPRSRTGGR